MNPRNHCILEGNLARNPEIKTNTDGSRRVLVTLAVNRDYKSKDGEYPVDYLSCEAYYGKNAKGNGVFDRVVAGSRIILIGELRSAMWTDAEGKKHYKQFFFVTEPKYGESKAVTDNRIAKKNGMTADSGMVLEGNFTELTEMSPEQIEAAYEIPTVQA